jgi:hypothetical protein
MESQAEAANVTGIHHVRIIARVGGSFLVAVDSDELPRGRFDKSLYLPVRRYDPRLDLLTEPLWWGSWVRHLGGYAEQPDSWAGQRTD